MAHVDLRKLQGEIEALRKSRFVELAQRYDAAVQKMQQEVQNLRTLERRGRELAEDGYSFDGLPDTEQDADAECGASRRVKVSFSSF